MNILRLNCYGSSSCQSAIVNINTTSTGSTVVCHGQSSCYESKFAGVKELWLAGHSAGNYGTFSSVGDVNNPNTMIVIMIGGFSGLHCTFNCLESDTCIFYYFSNTSASSNNNPADTGRTYNCDDSATCIHRTFKSNEWLDEIDNFINGVDTGNNNISLIRPSYESFNTSNVYESTNKKNKSSFEWWEVSLIVFGCIVLIVIIAVLINKRNNSKKTDKHEPLLSN